MPFSNYGDLKASIAGWLGDTSLTAQIPDFVSLGESRIADDLRSFLNEKTEPLTINGESVDAPSDYLQARSLYLATQERQRVDFVTPTVFWQKNPSVMGQGVPRFFTYQARKFIFTPTPTTASPVTGDLTFYFRFAAFVGDTDTNELLTSYPDSYLYASLIAASPFLGDDPRTLTWAQLYDETIERINKTTRDLQNIPGQRRTNSADYSEIQQWT